jgi:hypothetical protein
MIIIEIKEHWTRTMYGLSGDMAESEGSEIM